MKKAVISMSNYPRRGRKTKVRPDGTILTKRDQHGKLKAAISDMTEAEKKKHGKVVERMD